MNAGQGGLACIWHSSTSQRWDNLFGQWEWRHQHSTSTIGQVLNIQVKGSQSSMAETEPLQKSTISSALFRPVLYARVARRKPLLRRANIKACLNFSRRHTTKSRSLWKKIFGLKGKFYVCRTPNAAQNNRFTFTETRIKQMQAGKEPKKKKKA